MAFQALEAGDPARIGRYRIAARLGSGGMGRVYLGWSPGGRPVAVKVIRPDLAGDAGFARRFAREVAAARRVNGFFTAGLIDADPDGTPPWLATAYVPGMSLAEAMTEHGPWSEGSVRSLGAGLVEALEAIHAAGVVHRDLKPSNVLLAPDGPRVIDFGISIAAEGTALTQTMMMAGTPGFMSPEQLTGGTVGPPSDVFALGAVLTYAATGVGPFGSGSPHILNFRAVYEDPTLDALAPGLRGLVEQCLAKAPQARPTLAVLVDWLERARGNGPLGEQLLAAADWLPASVARTVRERTDMSLPRPGPPAPLSPTVGATPPQPPLPPTMGTTQPPPARGPSRRRLLAGAGGAAGVAAVGWLGWNLVGSGDSGDSDGSNGSNGSGDGTSDAPPRTVKIAYQGPTTGRASLLNAVLLAVREANDSGESAVSFEVFEAHPDSSGSVESAARLAVDEPDVLAVVGPVAADGADRAAGVYESGGLTAVTPSVSDMALDVPSFGTLLRGIPNDRQTGVAMAAFLDGMPVETVTLAKIDSSHGDHIASSAEQAMGDRGIEVPGGGWGVVAGDVDWSEVAAQALERDAVVFAGFSQGGLGLSRDLDHAGFDGVRVASHGVMDEEFAAEAEGWYVVTPARDLSLTQERTAFAERYRAEFAQEPGRFAAQAYDVTRMIIEAVRGLGAEAERGRVFDQLTGATHEGVTGVVSFGGDGEFAGTGPHLFRVEDGRFTPLGPAEDYEG
ncbi:bifunctional serine/threonine-protein kinase/ABC transporter substrate-binding protein [Streptomyces litchfieldiae]|uniref:Bifunctional serine/threonine-protein kinase/ABC transporter substrate-binding protein n=1 Tax=Streptomyces litchfieldiae TaxID=3075543 RepID=A0ABU2MK14_9ACTN|nr:bifunctional serine/threonine-protein kinase/ABC transporter substrate-binding protein [Streptomyces sp. DSM 44938]MDT0341821.1 bifunctional serine/threonine-protein kinase/ABC transporter substrate-binding protein [Streptomyces sp. DSM 44938]